MFISGDVTLMVNAAGLPMEILPLNFCLAPLVYILRPRNLLRGSIAEISILR